MHSICFEYCFILGIPPSLPTLNLCECGVVFFILILCIKNKCFWREETLWFDASVEGRDEVGIVQRDNWNPGGVETFELTATCV